jgi:hypothetical protein
MNNIHPVFNEIIKNILDEYEKENVIENEVNSIIEQQYEES